MAIDINVGLSYINLRSNHIKDLTVLWENSFRQAPISNLQKKKDELESRHFQIILLSFHL